MLQRYLKANFTLRRVLALLFGWGGIAVCIASVFDRINLSLWPTMGLFVLGLLILEWAG